MKGNRTVPCGALVAQIDLILVFLLFFNIPFNFILKSISNMFIQFLCVFLISGFNTELEKLGGQFFQSLYDI